MKYQETRTWYSCDCNGDSRQHTTSTTFGGRCFDKMVFVRRNTNLFTSSLSSVFRSRARMSCLSVASGSLPAKIGRSYFFANSPGDPAIGKEKGQSFGPCVRVITGGQSANGRCLDVGKPQHVPSNPGLQNPTMA